jgi:hypothetical protein
VGRPHLENEDLGARLGCQNREWKPDLVVEVPGGRRHLLSGVPEHGRQGILGRGLAHAAGDADDQRSIYPQERPPGQPLHRFQGIFHDEGRDLEGATGYGRHRAPQVRLGREVGPIRPAAQGEEEVPLAHDPGVRRRSAHQRVLVARGELGVEDPRHLSHGGWPHGLTLPDAASGGTLK